MAVLDSASSCERPGVAQARGMLEQEVAPYREDNPRVAEVVVRLCIVQSVRRQGRVLVPQGFGERLLEKTDLPPERRRRCRLSHEGNPLAPGG